jgi:hypothetical protein
MSERQGRSSGASGSYELGLNMNAAKARTKLIANVDPSQGLGYVLASSQRCVRVTFLDGSLMRKRLANSPACSLQCAAQTGLVVPLRTDTRQASHNHRAGKKLQCRQAS